MYPRTSKNYLPWLALSAGVTGLGLRQALYLVAVDSRGLLMQDHPLELALWVLTAVTLGYLGWSVRKLPGDGDEGLPPSLAGGIGQILAGAGILAAVALGPVSQDSLGRIWYLTGFLAGPCLMAAGICRARGKNGFFGLHLIPCLFFVFHTIDHYRVWSSDPQLQNYVFPLFACLSLMLFAYYNTARDVGICRWRMRMATGLAAVYLCAVSLALDASLPLYLGGMVWGLTGAAEKKGA